MAHYIHDEKNNRIEGMSKEEIYALLDAAIQQGQLPSVDADTAFVTMFKSIVDGKTYKMGFCTQAQYNELEAQGLLVADAFYIITDDKTYDDIETYLENLTAEDDQLKDTLAALANLINTKKINIYDGDGIIEGDGEGYLTIKGANDIVLKYDDKTTTVGDIITRLDELGFEQGSFTLAEGATAVTNSIKKLGKYVIATLDTPNYESVPLSLAQITVPTKFRPKANTTVSAVVYYSLFDNTKYFNVTINTDGTLSSTDNASIFGYFYSVGWEIN